VQNSKLTHFEFNNGNSSFMGLRNQVLRGGTYLALRQGLGMVLSLGGVLLITHVIGPTQYGLYTSANDLFLYVQIIAQLGISLYLIRGAPEEENRNAYHQASTLSLLLGIGGAALAIALLPLMQTWVRLEGFTPIAAALFLELPISLLAKVPLAKLERELNYKQVALFELANQITFISVASLLAFRGLGAWALVAGWWAQETQALLLFHWGAKLRPRWHWDQALVKKMLGYGIGFSAAQWVYQLRSLVNPLVVGRFGGAEAVGYVALVIRLVETLSFVKNATWRISIAALAKIQSDRPRLRQAVSEGMGLQVLALGPVLVAAAWALPVLIPLVFGDRWLPVTQVYPFVAFAYLTNATFNLHASVLYVIQKNWEVTLYHIVHVAAFLAAAIVLVPRLGMVGYGWAEMAGFIGYGVLNFYLVRSVGQPQYRLAAIWWAAFAAALFVYSVGWWMGLGLIFVLGLPQTWQTLQKYIQGFRNKVA
jgi:O-antigen/teichoic acid export membrane protein